MISELFLRVYNSTLEKSIDDPDFLTIVINDGDMEDLDIRKIRKHSEVMYLSTEYSLSKIPDGVQYYYQMEDFSFIKLITTLTGNKMFCIYDYEYLVIFDNRKQELVFDLDEFYERSRFQNQILIKDDLSLFSFKMEDLDKIEKLAKIFLSAEGKTVEGKKIYPEKSFIFTHIPIVAFV